MRLIEYLKNQFLQQPKAAPPAVTPMPRRDIKLSDAVVLGDITYPRDSETWFSNGAGCAIGRAFMAAGYVPARVTRHGPWVSGEELLRAWPWIDPYLDTISHMFREVCDGDRPFEDLVEYIKGVEDRCDPQFCELKKPEEEETLVCA